MSEQPKVTSISRRKRVADQQFKTHLIDDLNVSFEPFLRRNQESKIVPHSDSDGNTRFRIQNPWDDESLSLNIGRDPTVLANALNELLLPKRLSAIYHFDSRCIEVIFTSFSLADEFIDLKGRSFRFKYKGAVSECEFKRSSDRLLAVAKYVSPQTTSQTNFRNLQSFMLYCSVPKEALQLVSLDPISFWITNVDWDEAYVIDMIHVLNFYMRYFDELTPPVLVHDVQSNIPNRIRYLHGPFPENIISGDLDQTAISFWNATYGSNPMMAFILYYRVIEYAAFHYIDYSVRQELKRIVTAPNFSDNLLRSVDNIASALQVKGIEDITKFRMTIRTIVDPKLIWKEIQNNREFFCQNITLDGSFAVKALVSQTEGEDTFCNRGLDSFADVIRKIRNALAHGKDQETSGVITPSIRNFQMLRPWVGLISIAAGEIVLFKDLA